MKMKKKVSLPFVYLQGYLPARPASAPADVNIVPQNTTAAPTIPTAALQQLTRTPVDQSKTQSTQLAKRVSVWMLLVLLAQSPRTAYPRILVN